MNEAADLPVVPEAIRLTVESMSAPEIIEQRKDSPEWQEINRVERALAELPQLALPLRHLFTPVPGHDNLYLYTREIVMPAGALCTTQLHRQEHPFVISAGRVSVWSNDHGWQLFLAPYRGVTMPGTRRVLYVHEETTWTAFFITTSKDLDKIQEEVTYDHLTLGHLDDLSPDKIAAIKQNCRTPERILA